MRRFFEHNITPVEFLVLLSLKEGKKHGYGVMKDLQENFRNSWEVKSGTIYPALRRLEGRGYVQTSYDEAEQKEYYEVTEEGKHEIEESLTSIAEELGFSSRYFDFISHRFPKMKWRIDRKFSGNESLEFDPMDHMFEVFSGVLPKREKIEWLEKWEKRLEAKLAKIRHMLSEERKKGGDSR